MNLPVKIENIIPLSMPRSSSAPANIMKEKYGGTAVDVENAVDELLADMWFEIKINNPRINPTEN